RESHPQEFFQTGFWRGVGDEVLHLSGFNVAGDNQPVSAIGGPASHFGSVARALEPDLCASDFPDLRAQGLTTQGETLPRLTLERLSPDARVIDAFGHKWRLGRLVFGECRPAPEIGRNFADVELAQGVKVVEELRLAAIIFIEGEPVESNPVSQGAFNLGDAQSPFGLVDDSVGNMSGLAA